MNTCNSGKILVTPTPRLTLRKTLVLALILAASQALFAVARADTPPADAVAFFDTDRLPAAGTHDAILTVQKFGRYAIAVGSAQGTALQLVDRMAGPGDISGTPGAQDGRIDAFLERGTYKVHLIADPRGSGTATLTVTPFSEMQPSPVALVETKPVEGQLADHQQISWWLIVPSRGTYSFEAGGRYLADLRLWKDGAWLIGATPAAQVSNADPAQPLAVEQLTAQLEPGTYRLTAYGGAGLPWSQASADAPFLLRWGVPGLGDSGRSPHIASRFGTDRYLLPGGATDVRLVLDKPDTAGISVQSYDATTMFDTGGAFTAGIDKTSRDPLAELNLSPSNIPWLLTVTDRPGAKYRLEIFNQAGNVQLGNASGQVLLAATLPGGADDSIDTGFLLINQGTPDRGPFVAAADAIDLGSALPWRRHFNLLNPVSTYLYTDKNIDLRIDGTGARAQFVVDRFFLDTPEHRVPDAKFSGGVWELTPGYYTLTASPLPNGRGILTMSMYAAGHAPPRADSRRLPAALFGPIDLDPDAPNVLVTSLPDSVAYGLRQEFLPNTLAQPLSFELAPGKSIGFPLYLDQDGQFAATDETGAPLGFEVDGQKATGIAKLQAGSHAFAITGAGAGIQTVTLTETPDALLAATALPPIPPDLTAEPDLPLLQAGQPVFADLATGQSITYKLPVQSDALYRFETTGLLETGGAIRTRTIPSLASVEGNGVGRNFLLEPFLREGDYQLTVSAIGQTAGHAGITVARTPLTDEGDLAAGIAARTSLAPGQAALYHFHIPAEGVYRLNTLGLGHQFDMRLEDADGWPLIPPGGPADVTQTFAPGDYRMILLPGTVRNRAVTMLQQVLDPPVYAGHGPFQVAIGQDMADRWMEPAPGQPRTPDAWRFSLPAAATATITITPGMRARILPATPGAAPNAAPIATVIGRWTGRLPAADYVIDTYSAAPDNRVDYTLNVSLAELIPGQTLDIEAPATIPVSLGGATQYEIASAGDQDVRASLIDAAGRVVAANDDRDNDWNFLLSGNFPAGLYSLRVDPVGAGNAQTEISIAAPATVTDKLLRAGQTDRFADGLVHIVPLAAPAPGALLIASLAGAVPAGLTLEMNDGKGWRQIATTSGIDPYLAIPAGGGGTTYRLRGWAEDHGATPLDLTTAAAAPAAASLTALAAGLDLSPVSVGRQTFGLARIAVPAPTILQLAGPSGSLAWTSAANAPAEGEITGTIAAAGPDLWMLDAAPHRVAAAAADILHAAIRLDLGAGQKLTLRLPAEPDGSVALWQATAQGGVPGIAMTGDGQPVLLMAATGKAGLFASSVAFQPAGLANPALSLWQAGAAQPALPVTLRRTGFATPAPFAARTGGNDGVLPAGGALQTSLPGGWNRLALSLPEGAAAILLGDGRPQSIIAADGARPDIIDSQADSLILLNPGQAGAFSLSIQSLTAPQLRLGASALLTSYNATPATLHIALQNGAPAPLRIAGAAVSVAAIDAAGAITTGAAASAESGGTASVTVQPGLAVISVDGLAPCPCNAQDVAVPGSTELAGRTETLAIAAGPARLLHFETDTPVVLRNRTTGIPAVFPAGAATNIFQPKGRALDLQIQAAGGGLLSGQARFDVIPATPITDGLGPRILIPPGGARLFTFSLTAPRAIGAGIRGSVDDATIRLLASDGSQIGAGIVTMQTLPAGTYYLTAEIPPDAPASEIQPALAGTMPPDDGPPGDVIASYAALGP